jgi:hypothetical protein
MQIEFALVLILANVTGHFGHWRWTQPQGVDAEHCSI